MTNTLPALPSRPTPEAVLHAYREAGYDPDGFEGYMADGFESTVGDVVTAMRDANMFGDYAVSLSLDSDGYCISGGQYVILCPSPAGGTLNLSSLWIDVKHLTEDRAATGEVGILAIASAVYDDVAATLARAREWIAAT